VPAIVGIHGIAKQFTSGPQLTTLWFDALRGGLEAAGYRIPAEHLSASDLRVAFFGDLFRPSGAMAAGDPPFNAADVLAGPERDLLTAWYEGATTLDPSLGPGEGAMGWGRVAVQVMLDRLLRSGILAGVAQRAFIGNLKQVNAFLSDATVNNRVLRRVDAEIDDATRVVIGHSLGSVVAYEYLCRHRPPAVELFVSLGSPLGIPNLVFDRLTPSPTGGVGVWPADVRTWVNVADADDFVSLRKQLNDLFRPSGGAKTIDDRRVDNGNAPHAADRYLNTAQVGDALGAFL